MHIPDIKRYLRIFIKDEQAFFRDTSTVFGGKFFIALLTLIITPVLTRLYTPEAYGTFALYNSVVQNMVILGTLALPAALNTAKKEFLANILWLTLLCTLAFSIILAVSLYFINVQYSEYWSVQIGRAHV